MLTSHPASGDVTTVHGFRPESTALVRPLVGTAISDDGQLVARAAPRHDPASGRSPLELGIADVGVGARSASRTTRWHLVAPPTDGAALASPTFAPDSRHLATLEQSPAATRVLVASLDPGAAAHGGAMVSAWQVAATDADGAPVAAAAPKWDGEGALHVLGQDADGWRRVWVWRDGLGAPPTARTPAGEHAGDYAVRTTDRTLAWLHLPEFGDAASEALPVQIVRSGGEATTLAVPGRPVGWTSWSPDGRWLAYLARRPGERLSVSTLWIVDVDAALARPEVERTPEALQLAGLARALTRDLPGRITGYDWEPASGSVVLALVQGVAGRLVRLGTDPAQVPEGLGPADTYLSGPHVDRSRSRLIHLHQDVDLPQRLVLRPAPGEPGRSRSLTTFHRPLRRLGLGQGRTLRWRAADGLPLEGVLVSPPEHAPRAPDRPPPLLLWVHGGPAEHVARTFSPYFQSFAARGWAVFAPNYRGSSGRDEAFLRANVGDLGGADVGDLQSALAAVAADGAADVSRTLAVGWSYGGSLALHLASRELASGEPTVDGAVQPAALVVGAPVVDWVGFFGARQFPSLTKAYFPAPPWRDREPFDRASPLGALDKLAAPTLVLHGGFDGIVPVGQSRLLYRALKDLGVPTDLMVYAGEGHVLGTPAAVVDMLERVLAWGATHVLGAPSR